MGTKVGQIDIDLVLNNQKFDKSIRQSAESGERKMGSAMGKIAKWVAIGFSTVSVVKFSKECIKLGSDLLEIQNVVDTVFTEFNKNVDNWSKNAISQFGISEQVSKRYIGIFGAMSKSFGFTEKEAYSMATTLTGLVGDVASFYNITQDEAFVRLKAIYSGETESIKELGVVITQNALDQYALANGYGKTTEQMTEQEKVALRYAFVQEKLALATGDFLRTEENWANQTRVLKLRFDQLKSTLGQGLINVLSPVVKMLNLLVAKLQVLADGFKSLTEAFKKKKEDSVLGGVKDDLDDANNSAGDLTDGIGEVGDQTEETAEQIAASLMGFDELNKLSSKKDVNTGEGTGDLIDMGDIDFTLPDDSDMEDQIAETEAKFAAMAQRIKDTFSTLFAPIRNAWETDGQAFVDSFKGAFHEMWELIKSIGRSFEEVWTNGTGEKAVRLILGIFTDIYDVIKNIAVAFKNAWNDGGLGTEIIQSMADIFNTILKTIKNITASSVKWSKTLNFKPLLESVKSIFEAIEPLTQNIGDGLEYFWNNVLLPIANWTIEDALPSFLNMVASAIKALNSVIEALKPTAIWFFENFLKPIANFTADAFVATMDLISDKLNSFSNWCKENQETVDKIAKVVGTLAIAFGAVSGAMKAFNLISAIGSSALGILSKAFGFLTSPVGLIIIAIGLLIAEFVHLWNTNDEFKAKMTKIWDDIKSKLQEVWNNLKPIFEEAWGLLTDLFNWIKDDLWPKIEPIIQALIEFVASMIPPILDLINVVLPFIKEALAILRRLWNDVLEPLFNYILDTIVPLIVPVIEFLGATFKAVFESITDVLGWALDLITDFMNFIVDVFSGNWEKAWDDICKYFIDIWNGIMGFFGSIGGWFGDRVKDIKNAFSGIGEWFHGIFQVAINQIKNIFSGIGSWFGNRWIDIKNAFSGIGSWFSGTFTSAKKGITDVFSNIGSWFSGTFTSAKKGITDVFSNIGSWFGDRWKDIKNGFNGIGEWFSGTFTNAKNGAQNAFSNVGSFFSGVWANIKKPFANIANWFKNKFTDAWTAVKNVFSKGGEIFKGIQEGISSTFKTVVNGLIDGINAIISTPFKKINQMLNSIKDVSFLGLKPFNWIQRDFLPIPRIPRLAQGGYVGANQPQLAMIGDNKTQGEIVSPENKMYEIFTKALKSFTGQNTNNGQNVSPTKLEITLMLDSKTIGTKVVDFINNENRRIGKSVIKY